MDRADRLGNDKIPSLLLTFSIPAIVGMVVQALYNFVDRIFVGNGVGKDALAAITVAMPLMLICMACGMLIGMGAGAVISIKLGEKRRGDAQIVLCNAFEMLLVMSALVIAAGHIWMRPMLVLFGADETIMPQAMTYSRIILSGFTLQTLSFGMNNFIRAEGSPRTAMATMLIGAVVNAILDPIFIFVFKWGIAGAALATVLGQGASTIWVLHYFISGKSLLRFSKPAFRPDLGLIKGILAIGFAPFSMQIAASLLHTILNAQLKKYGGPTALAVAGIIFSFTTLILMPIFGIRQGTQPIIGYNYGARLYARTRHTLMLAIMAATVITTLGFMLTQLIPSQIIRLFCGFGDADIDELLKMGVPAVRYFNLLLAIVGFQIVASGYFQAIGKASVASFLSLSRQLLVMVPLLVFLPRFMGPTGIWITSPLSDLVSSLLTAGWLAYEFTHLKTSHQQIAE